MTTSLVTGANRGIGLELVEQLAARGDDVIAACRRSSPELDAVGARVETGVDVTDDDAVGALADKLEGTRIDVLVLCAGVLLRQTLADLDFDGIRRQLEVNSLGPLRVAAALHPNLGQGSKIAIITSRMGSIADNSSGGSYGYRMSKAAVNAAGVSLARDLAAEGIAVVLLHPGWVKTEMTGGTGHITAEEAARGLIARIDELTLEGTGTFRHQNGEPLPW